MKKSLLYIIPAIVILAVNIIPQGTMPQNGEYYKDLMYLGLYDGGAVIGESPDGFGSPLNTHHILLTALRLLPGTVFPVAALTAFYLIILGVSLFILFKALKDYKGIAMVIIALVLCTKKYLGYLLTVLPFGGIFTLLISIVAVLTAVSVSKKVSLPLLCYASVLSLLFAGYNNITAIIAVVLGILIIRLGGKKTLSFIYGAIVIVVSGLFAFIYKGIEYQDIIKSGVENGIGIYGGGTASSYTQLVVYYFKNIPAALAHIQSLLNSAFYNPPAVPFAIINKLKALILPSHIWLFTALLVAVVGYAVTLHKKYPKAAELAVGLVAMSVIALLIPGFLYGISNLLQNLLLFNLIFDLLISLGITGVVYIAARNKEDFKEKYGATQ